MALHHAVTPSQPTRGAGERAGRRQLPQLGVGRQFVNVGVVHSQQDVFWLDVCVDNLAFSVQVI